jgi:DNA-binding NarL/FixJ family response regulator
VSSLTTDVLNQLLLSSNDTIPSFAQDCSMPTTQTTRSARLRVIVAEDHPHVRKEITRFLDTHFDVVSAVDDGQRLVEAAALLQPDVIISDISMPRLTGPEAMRQLKNLRHDVPFVLVSLDSSSASHWIEEGAAAFVHKSDMYFDLVPAIDAVAAGQTFLSRSARTLEESLP